MEQNESFITYYLKLKSDLFNNIAIKKHDRKYRQSLRNERNILTK